MQSSVIPSGLNYVLVRRRHGVLSNYNAVFRNTMALSDFYLIDDYVQAQIKNFGQLDITLISAQANSEVYIMKLLESKAVYEHCTDFEIVPITINGVEYDGKAVEILFEDIVAILPTENDYSLIYATTNPIEKQTPVIYEVGYNVTELWDYIKDCSFPSY